MKKGREIVMTVWGAVCLVLLSPLLLVGAAVFAIYLLLRAAFFYPGFRKSGFPGKFSPRLGDKAVFRTFCALPPEKRSNAVYSPGDLPLLRLADGTVIAAPEALLFYRLTEENAGTIGAPGEWIVDVSDAPPVDLSAFFREAEGKQLCPLVVTPDQPAVLPEDEEAFRAESRFVRLSDLSHGFSLFDE